MVCMIIFAAVQSIADNNARKKVEETMPKTYEYIEFNRSPSLVWQFCKKTTETDEMVSDELCYNRLRTFESCQNLKNNTNTSDKLEKLVSLITNKQQAETIINSCKLKKQEILKEEINKLGINEETNKEELNKEKVNKEETNKEVVNVNNEILNTMVENL